MVIARDNTGGKLTQKYYRANLNQYKIKTEEYLNKAFIMVDS